MLLERLIVEFDADMSRMRKEFQQAERTATTWSRSVTNELTKVRSGAALLAGSAGVGLATAATFRLGASVEETASKFRTALGPEVRRASTFIASFGTMAGLSNRQAQEMLATTVSMARGMGYSAQGATDLGIAVAKLSGDLSSFNNIPIEETSQAVRAAITGEREQLKRYGIVIQETDVQKRALLNTGKEHAKALTQEEKATATLQLITERAGVAVGDLARTKDSAANQARALTAEIENIKESIAQSFLPAMAWGIRGASGFIKGLQIMGAEAAVTVAKIELAFAKKGTGSRIAGFLGLGEGAGLFDPLGLDLFSKAVGAGLGKTVEEATANLARMEEAAEAVRMAVVGLAEASTEAARGVRELNTSTSGSGGGGGSRLNIPNAPMRGMPTRLGMGVTSSNMLPFGMTLGPARATAASEAAVAGFFADIQAQVSDIGAQYLDPSILFSNLASQGIGALSSWVFGSVGSMLFGGDGNREAMREQARQLALNSERIAELRAGIGSLDRALLGEQGSTITGVTKALDMWLNPSKRGGFSPAGGSLQDWLRHFGVSMEDLARLAERFGIELNDSTDSFQALQEVLESDFLRQLTSTFDGAFGLLRQEFDLLDITDPMEKFGRSIDLVAGLVSDDLAATLRGLTPESLDAFIGEFLGEIRAGNLAVFDQLGQLSIDQFLEFLGFAESSLDQLGDAANKATEALRNTPAGFKVALARFNASDPESNRVAPLVTTGGGGSIATGVRGAVADALAAMPGAGATFTGPIYVTADDPMEFIEKLEASTQWRQRTGAYVIPTTTRRG